MAETERCENYSDWIATCVCVLFSGCKLCLNIQTDVSMSVSQKRLHCAVLSFMADWNLKLRCRQSCRAGHTSGCGHSWWPRSKRLFQQVGKWMNKSVSVSISLCAWLEMDTSSRSNSRCFTFGVCWSFFGTGWTRRRPRVHRSWAKNRAKKTKITCLVENQPRNRKSRSAFCSLPKKTNAARTLERTLGTIVFWFVCSRSVHCTLLDIRVPRWLHQKSACSMYWTSRVILLPAQHGSFPLNQTLCSNSQTGSFLLLFSLSIHVQKRNIRCSSAHSHSWTNENCQMRCKRAHKEVRDSTLSWCRNQHCDFKITGLCASKYNLLSGSTFFSSDKKCGLYPLSNCEWCDVFLFFELKIMFRDQRES